jgi:hypothetical protein
MISYFHLVEKLDSTKGENERLMSNNQYLKKRVCDYESVSKVNKEYIKRIDSLTDDIQSLTERYEKQIASLKDEKKETDEALQYYNDLYNNEKHEVAVLNELIDEKEADYQTLLAHNKEKKRLLAFADDTIYHLNDEVSRLRQSFVDLLDAKDGFVGFSRMLSDFNHIGSAPDSDTIIQDRANRYKYEYLLTIFPDLSDYVDDYNPFCDKEFMKRYKDKDLSVDEEQESLDVFIENEKKSKIAYGIAYEMYIGYKFRDKGWDIIQYGVEMGVHDKGRDIIASKTYKDGSKTIYIIQCKNWAEWKTIPECYICQLYGTTEEYRKEHATKKTRVKALFVCSCQLSNTAIRFCGMLGVEYRVMPFSEFPRIKCNISPNGKLYFLPFDPQYNSVKIKNKGEMYVKTVKEAQEAGFVRAYKNNKKNNSMKDLFKN